MSNLAGMNAAPVHCISFGREDDRKQVLQKFRTTGKLRDTHTVFTVPAGCLSAAVCTRNHNWDNDEYQKGVVAPYERIQEIQGQLDENGGLPSREQMLEALELLKKIFITKKVPAAEQVKRFKRIFAETGTEYLFQGDKGFKIPTA
jgi:[acyl-carrier-protein] S-malonyltransferase